ncbi:nucleotidyltransferase family protein [Inconstantimicrobium porci]|uniref:Nucleotidyltransferase domain-containing protein n=2 Tax=Inconstantimicrobium porci TaxID=2652291 RepID=A0A7X2N115_9CLOT|nr:nucleotidyltransferase domain-containing protein [Inconstantimicrobium porci]MSR92285.1 nucleotidyltransferase domain-containing protein [Inconstantimicrobium porci]
MMFSNIHDNLKSKEEILSIINSDKFKNIFLSNNINNVIIFGSIRNTSFNDESDIDIAVISEKPLDINTELKINLSLEEMLERDVDLIDINDNKVNNVIKIDALNSEIVILSDNLLNITREFYDNLCKENEEFWRILDREVLGIE